MIGNVPATTPPTGMPPSGVGNVGTSDVPPLIRTPAGGRPLIGGPTERTGVKLLSFLCFSATDEICLIWL